MSEKDQATERLNELFTVTAEDISRYDRLFAERRKAEHHAAKLNPLKRAILSMIAALLQLFGFEEEVRSIRSKLTRKNSKWHTPARDTNFDVFEEHFREIIRKKHAQKI